MTDDDVRTIVEAMTVACQTPRTAVQVPRAAFTALSALGFESEAIETRLGRVVAHTRGSGPCCLFLHPLLFGSEVYDEVFKCLPPSLRIVALDLWGHGAAGPALGTVTLADAADVVAGVLARLHPGDEPLAVCGTSMGGMLALRLGLRCGERVDRLLLIGTSADAEEGPARRTFEALLDVGTSLGAGAVVPDLMGVMLSHRFSEIAPQHMNAIGAYLSRQSAADVRPVVEAVLRRESIRDELKNIRARALVVVGQSDLAEPPAHSEALSADLAAALLFPVPNAGHLLPIERPELVAGLVTRTLAR